MSKALGSFATRIALPFLTLVAGCSFFELSDTGEQNPRPGSGGTGPMSGNGGAISAGRGGSVAMGGSMAGSAGSAGASAGRGGDGGSSAGSSGAGGSPADGGTSAAGSAGSAGAGNTGGGAAGGGTAGTAGAAGSGGNANPPMSCAELNSSSVEFDEHCYLRINSPITWRLAKAACEALNAHLVTISSEGRTQEQFDAENAFVWQLAGMMDVWIGLSDGRQDTENGDGNPPFTWVTGEPFTMNHWGGEEPNHYQKDCPDGSDCWEHCTFMWQERNGEWNDEVCAFQKQYICEWDSLE
jgi:hypothetical protein